MRARFPLHRVGRVLLRALGALVLPGALTLLYTQASGCGAPCSGPDRVFDGGERWTVGTGKDGTVLEYWWESSPIDGPFLPFEGNATYHLQHKLGVRPEGYEITLSFSDRPEVVGNGGSSPSAGNLSLIQRTSEDEIVIKSDTCANYFIRVVVHGHSATTTDGGVDAASDGASTDALDATSDAATDAPTD